MDDLYQSWAGQIAAAAAARQPLNLCGSGSKAFYGQPAAAAESLSTAACSGVVAYEPTELVVTVRAGTPLATLEALLAERGQQLAFEPPHFGPGATVGGMVAAGLAGPARASVGAVRDFILGIKMIDGQGQILNFGGQVMKNVAGYDVPRLMAGSLGTLGLILEVSLKVLPRPVAEATLGFDRSEADALQQLNQWGGQPLPLSAACWHDGRLLLRLRGAEAAIAAASTRLGGEALAADAADHCWAAVREQQHAFFAGEAPLWRLSLPSTAPAQNLGATLIEWGGSQRWLRGEHEAAALRTLAARAGGHAVLFRGTAAQRTEAGAFAPLTPALAAIHRRLKAAFDPHGIFNRGRLYPDF